MVQLRWVVTAIAEEEKVIRTEGLWKEYNGFVAVRDVTLHVEPGEIYGFLGPNGAGKTTTILMLLGIEKPTRGHIRLFGGDLDSDYFGIKRRIGVVAEHQYLYDDMTAREYLNFFAQLYRVEDADHRIEELLEAVDLRAFADVRAHDYSRGMQQKLGLVRALLHDPDLLILDEPVSGLDPYGIVQVRTLIQEQNRQGKTVFISSHILSEVERTAHRVGIINGGELRAEDTMADLRRRLSSEGRLEIEVQNVDDGLVQAVSQLPFVHGVELDDRTLTVRTRADRDYRAEISRQITARGGIILAMRSHEMSLEEAFVTITEKNISLLTPEAV